MIKKDAGFVDKLLPVLLGAGIVFGLVLLSGSFVEIFEKREAVNQIARAKLLSMETKGYLDEADISELKLDLEKKCSLQNVEFQGSTVSKVSYGAPIYLCIQGNMVIRKQVQLPYIYEKNEPWTIPIHLTFYSTAKH